MTDHFGGLGPTFSHYVPFRQEIRVKATLQGVTRVIDDMILAIDNDLTAFGQVRSVNPFNTVISSDREILEKARTLLSDGAKTALGNLKARAIGTDLALDEFSECTALAFDEILRVPLSRDLMDKSIQAWITIREFLGAIKTLLGFSPIKSSSFQGNAPHFSLRGEFAQLSRAPDSVSPERSARSLSTQEDYITTKLHKENGFENKRNDFSIIYMTVIFVILWIGIWYIAYAR